MTSFVSTPFIELASTVIFTLAIVHTFMSGWFNKLAKGHAEGSVGENFFHLMGEIEVIFGMWLIPLMCVIVFDSNTSNLISFFERPHMLIEPFFVVAIVIIASSKPILSLSENFVLAAKKLFFFIPLDAARTTLTILFWGPLLGSLITEPAAITITALLLKKFIFPHLRQLTSKYALLAVLFVNISVGGVLTNFAAPPVLMVAQKWALTNEHMFMQFGLKAILIVALNALGACLFLFIKEKHFFNNSNTHELSILPHKSRGLKIPWGVSLIHVLFLFLVVINAHHLVIYLLLLLFFVGFTEVTREYQSTLQIRGGLLVGFFLLGLVYHAELQAWWLKPLLSQISAGVLFLGSTILTAFNDNAAITRLASLSDGFSANDRYAVLSGAVVGGGMTLLANAPNPVGFALLKEFLPNHSLEPLRLMGFALGPTLLGMFIFWCC